MNKNERIKIIKTSWELHSQVERGRKTIDLNAVLFPKVTNFVFEIDANVEEDTKALFKIW